MARSAAVLGIHLLDANGQAVRAGTLGRDATGAVAFVPDEAYLRDEQRPILSLAWHVPGDPQATRARLASRDDKIALYGGLPPWFEGLLPEGALRELVDAEMGPGDHGSFDVLARLGGDLPGAVLASPENSDIDSLANLRLDKVAGFKAAVPQGVVKFSLAGVQLKFAAAGHGKRFTAPARAGDGRYILKLASTRYPGLPEAEFSAMTLARSLGVKTANCQLIDKDQIADIPERLLEGDTALAVERFDRRPDTEGRVHIEDAAQILGAVGDQKYTRGNSETVLHMIQRFSTDWREDVLEGMRRLVVDVLLGNADNHLKNWSFIFPEPGEIRLSPAYDIVPTVLFTPADATLGLKFAGVKAFSSVGLNQFRRVASYLKLDPDWIDREIRILVERATDTWPAIMRDLPLIPPQREALIARWSGLRLIEEVGRGR